MAKKSLKSYTLISAGDMSGNITSSAIDAQFVDNIGIQLAWTSSDAVGVLSVQCSIDGVTYYDLTFNPTLTQPASNNGGYLINLNQLPWPYYRLKYTRTSGSGTLVVLVSHKEI